MQVILVILTIAGAVAFLGWQFYKKFWSKETKCDGCAVGKMADNSTRT